MEDVTPAAPAQSEPAPAPITAPVAMPASGEFDADFTAYRETRRAARSGTPAPAPVAEPVVDTPPAATAAPVEEPRQVSKRQQQINAYERRIAEQDQRIRALEARSATSAPEPAAPRTAPVAGETFPAYAQYLETHPDASLEDYIDARQDFRDDKKARATAAQRQQAEDSRSDAEQIERSIANTEALRASDRAVDARLAAWETGTEPLPELIKVQTRAQLLALAKSQGVDPDEVRYSRENDLATELAKSDHTVRLLIHLTDHPEDLAHIKTLKDRGEVIKFVGKLEARFEKAADAAPVPVPPKTISSAPTPGTPLGTRPASAVDPVRAAVISGDVTAYRAAKRARESATRR